MKNNDNHVAKTIISRRTIYAFKKDLVPDKECIKDVIQQACFAPNHHLTEPWRFYLPGRETSASICALYRDFLTHTVGEKVAAEKYHRWLTVPGWLVVSCQKSEDKMLYHEDYAACCCAIQNLMLLLWEQGIGTKWSTSSIIKEQRFYDLVWVNNVTEHIIGLIGYGYPAEIPRTARKPTQHVFTELP